MAQAARARAPGSNTEPPGRTIGRYTVLTRLATGGMAEIYLARQTGAQGFEKLVALKQILPSYAADPDFVEMFFDEARIAAQLSHPNIVQIYDLGEDAGSAFIAMEYLAGESLASLARAARKSGRHLPVEVGARLISQAAEALHYAHRKTDHGGRPLGIIHRDVSPQNLMVTYDGALKVLDFGIAKAANRASHTMEGTVRGKLAYMSPEQAAGRPLDPRSDVFALGVVLYEVLTGTRLFLRDSPAATFAAITGDEPIPSLRDHDPEIPAELEEIVMRSLERDLEQRTASAGELHEQLEAWLRTQAYPSASEIAGLMQELFAATMRDRAALVARAARGEEISQLNRSDTENSMPGGTPASTARAQPRRWPLIAAAVGGVVLIAGIAVVLLAPREAPPVQIVVPVQAAPRPPTPAPAPAPTVLRISTDPAGGTVVIDDIERGRAPVSVEGLAVGEHRLRVRLEGRPDLEKSVAIDRAGQTMELLLSLPAPTPAPVAPAAPVAKPVERRPAARMGKLTLQTIPWTHVYLGEKSLGDTPLIEVPVPAGTYQLRLENPEKHLRQMVEVTIQAGQVTTTKLRF